MSGGCHERSGLSSLCLRSHGTSPTSRHMQLLAVPLEHFNTALHDHEENSCNVCAAGGRVL